MSETKSGLELADFPSEFCRGLGIREIKNKRLTILTPGDHILPVELKRLRSVLQEKLGCRVVLVRNKKTRKCCLRIHGRHADTFRRLKEIPKERAKV